MTTFIPHNIGNCIFVTPIQDLLWIGNDTSTDSNFLIHVIEGNPSSPTPPNFVSSITALKSLHSPFASLRDVIEDEPFIYIISDPPGQRSLRAFVEERGPVPEATIKEFVCQFIDAARRYAEATSAPFILTYDQVFVNDEGSLEQVFVSTQLPVDDLAFRAPELLSDHEGPECVIWCAAVFIYYLALGKLPFSGANPQELMKQIARSQPEIPSTLSPELTMLLMKMFVKNPMARIGLEKLGKEPWMAVPEAGRALFVERRRSLTRLIPQPVPPVAAHDDVEVTKRTLMKGVRIIPRKLASVRLVGPPRSPGPLGFGKSAFPSYVQASAIKRQ
jgi:serine/threonine protein kinase